MCAFAVLGGAVDVLGILHHQRGSIDDLGAVDGGSLTQCALAVFTERGVELGANLVGEASCLVEDFADSLAISVGKVASCECCVDRA